jgi:OPT family oligopeptide transporter
VAIQELSEEQVRTMTLQEKDEWWLKNIFKGDAPQLNLRSALTGMILGSVLSLTNLYIGIRTGWTLGVGVSSVILSFALFKLLSKLKIGREMTLLENNAMQSIATSAGYMTAPLASSIPAYMMVTGHVIPMGQAYIWTVVLALMGVLFAFPLKKRFINDEQLPFPEGAAAGFVMDSLHSDDEREGTFKAKILMIAALVSATIQVLRSDKIMVYIKMPFLTLPEYWDDLLYKYVTPRILGTPLKDLTIRIDSSIVMLGTGGLMNIKTGMSLMIGAFINYFILAPIMIQNGVIEGGGFKHITMWALWGGAAMMTTSSLYSFFSKPQVLIEAFGNLFAKGESRKRDVLEHIELPIRVSVIGVPILGALLVYLGHEFFGISYLMGIIAIPLVFVFTLIAVTATGLTSITPGGALGKLTQITFSVLAPGNVSTNLITAGITSDVSLSASNLLSDIKPGYMLGAKPRQQAIGHVLGIFAGGLVSIPVFYMIFHGDISLFTSEQLPMPGATVWKAVAQFLTKGLSTLHPTAQIAVVIGALLGILFEFLSKRTNGKFPLSGVGMGLAFVLTFTDSLSMSLGSFLFWYFEKRYKEPGTQAHRILVDNRETMCAGVIAGGSIIGIIIILLETAM